MLNNQMVSIEDINPPIQFHLMAMKYVELAAAYRRNRVCQGCVRKDWPMKLVPRLPRFRSDGRLCSFLFDEV
jgi:hypothetical protein